MKGKRAARLCGERSNVPRDSAVLYGAGMMLKKIRGTGTLIRNILTYGRVPPCKA